MQLIRIDQVVKNQREFYENEEEITRKAEAQLKRPLILCSLDPSPVVDFPYEGKMHRWFPDDSEVYLEVKTNGYINQVFLFKRIE